MVDINATLVSHIQPRDEQEKLAIEFARFEINEMRSSSNEIELSSPEEDGAFEKKVTEYVQGLTNILKSKLVGLRDKPNKSENTKSTELKIQKMVEALGFVLVPPSFHLIPDDKASMSALSLINNAKNPFDIKIPLNITRSQSRDALNKTLKAKELTSLENKITLKDQVIEDLQKKILSLQASAVASDQQTNIISNLKASLKEKDEEIASLKQVNIELSENYEKILDLCNERDELIKKLQVQLQVEEEKAENENMDKLKLINSKQLQDMQHMMEAQRILDQEKLKLSRANNYLMTELEKSEKLRNDLERELYEKEDNNGSYQLSLNLLEEAKK